jgi:hypothetical protein
MTIIKSQTCQSGFTLFRYQRLRNKHAKDIHKDLNFYSTLTACRFFNIIDDTEYDLINQVRRARNTYSHELENYHANQVTDLERWKNN